MYYFHDCTFNVMCVQGVLCDFNAIEAYLGLPLMSTTRKRLKKGCFKLN